MNTKNKIYHYCVSDDIPRKEFDDFVNCYIEIFNNSWKEKWTKKEAENIIKSGLNSKNGRKSSVSLLFDSEKVVGFSWIGLGTEDTICIDDMPYDISEIEKENGIKAIKFWMKLVGHKKIIIFKELGIYGNYTTLNGDHMATKISLPIIERAYEDGYRAIFCWTSSINIIFNLGLGFFWHPIQYYPDQDRVIMVGGVKKFIYYLRGTLNRDMNIINEMQENKKKYLII